MDKLRKLFHLKDRKVPEGKIGESRDEASLATPPQSPNSKRRRGKDETTFTNSPKKFRSVTPDLSPQNQNPRISNLSGSTPRESTSSATQAEPPKLEWKPMHTDLSSIFEDVSAESQPRPRPRPLKDQPNGQLSTAGKRQSLPPQAIFARAAKDFSDIPALTSTNGAGSNPYSTQDHAMTLDDLLTQPLFGERQPTTT